MLICRLVGNVCSSFAGSSRQPALDVSQAIEGGMAGLVGTLWSGARAAAREARELAAALELEKAGRRAASLLDSGIEVRMQGSHGRDRGRCAWLCSLLVCVQWSCTQ